MLAAAFRKLFGARGPQAPASELTLPEPFVWLNKQAVRESRRIRSSICRTIPHRVPRGRIEGLG